LFLTDAEEHRLVYRTSDWRDISWWSHHPHPNSNNSVQHDKDASKTGFICSVCIGYFILWLFLMLDLNWTSDMVYDFFTMDCLK